MIDIFFAALIGFVCLGYTRYVGIMVLRHGGREIDALSARVDQLENEPGENND